MPITVITGSASGIGAATRSALEAAGHVVIGVDLRDADVVGDLSSPHGRARVLAGVSAELEARGGGRLDGLLPALRQGQDPSAVVISSVASSQLSWDRNPLAAALEAGDEAAAGAIVDGAGDKGGQLAYAGSKNAVTVAVRRRAPEWGRAGVRLNTVAPGAVETPLLQAGLQDPRYGQAIRDFIAPIARRARPEEIAAMVAYLMGPHAGFIHGAQFFVDGGVDAMMRPTQF